MVLGVFVLGVIYAMPNFYPPDYAIQISRGSGGLDLSERELDVALEALSSSNVQIKASSLEGGSGLIRLENADEQLRAQPLIQRALHDLQSE